MVSQLHQLLLELIPGGAKKDLSAAQANALLEKVRPDDQYLAPPGVDRLLADIEIMRNLSDAATLLEKVEDLATKARRVTLSSQSDLLVSGTRIQKSRRRRSRDTPAPRNPGRSTCPRP
jgi:hypothetical protein